MRDFHTQQISTFESQKSEFWLLVESKGAHEEFCQGTFLACIKAALISLDFLPRLLMKVWNVT